MKHSDPIPDHLKPVRDMLMDSADGPADDAPPAAPDDLLDDLEQVLTDTTATPASTGVGAPGFLQKLTRFLASPAFGVAAALIVVLFIAVPLLQGPGDDPGRMRNAGNPTGDAPRVVFTGADQEAYAALVDSDLFDSRALVRVATSGEADAIESPKVVVDFKELTLRVFAADGGVVHREQIVPGASLPGAIAEAISRLPESR